MRKKGVRCQPASNTKAQVSTSLDPEVVARIEKLATDQNKSRALVIAEILDAGLLKLSKEKIEAKKLGLNGPRA